VLKEKTSQENGSGYQGREKKKNLIWPCVLKTGGRKGKKGQEASSNGEQLLGGVKRGCWHLEGHDRENTWSTCLPGGERRETIYSLHQQMTTGGKKIKVVKKI